MTQEEKAEDLKVEMSQEQVTPRLWTIHRDGEVLTRLSKHGPGHESPMTIPEFFRESVNRFGSYPALASKKNGKWEVLNYNQYYEACRKIARAMLKLGLEPFHSVGILGFNSTEWVLAALGAIFAGGFCVGIYATNFADACEYVITHAKVNILLVENNAQLQKILSLSEPGFDRSILKGAHGRDLAIISILDAGGDICIALIPSNKMETLKAIVQYKPPVDDSKCENLYSWDDFLELGSSIPDAQLDQIIKSQKVNQCAVIIYTSGTTGQPKGVMLSHDNITWTAGSVARDCNLAYASEKQEVVVSYLPLSHIAAQMMDVWVPIKVGAFIYFAEPDALKGTLVNTLQEVKPTAFLGVPRIWEKMHEKIKEAVGKSSSLRKKVFLWARNIGLKVNLKRMLGEHDPPMSYRMAKALVFTKIKNSLGLDHCRIFISGAAPLNQETSEFFLSLDIPIGDVYGMSESSGPHSISTLANYKFLSSGKVVTGCKNMLYQPSKDGVGEVCLWGRHVFMGYLEQEDATREAIDEEGWLHSGDLGRMDNQGFLFITGRIKEIIITAGGENVAPGPIENLVKETIPIISNAMLVGDKAKFLSILLTLKCEVDKITGEPLDVLNWEAIKFCQEVGSQATTVSEILELRDPMVYAAIQKGISAVNQKAISNAQKIQKWVILEKDFSISGGELGPTTKIKRHFILQKYRRQIYSIYQ